MSNPNSSLRILLVIIQVIPVSLSKNYSSLFCHLRLTHPIRFQIHCLLKKSRKASEDAFSTAALVLKATLWLVKMVI